MVYACLENEEFSKKDLNKGLNLWYIIELGWHAEIIFSLLSTEMKDYTIYIYHLVKFKANFVTI